MESMNFKIDCEWLCNFVRDRIFNEGTSITMDTVYDYIVWDRRKDDEK